MSTHSRIHDTRLPWLALAIILLAGLYLACGTQTPMAGLPGPEGPMGSPGPAGVQGPPGPAGADGLARVYGNGSAGAKVVSADEDWLTAPPTNLMFTDFTVNAGVELRLPSGTVIRCTGTFTNNGNIVVTTTGASGGSPDGTIPGMIQASIGLPDPGISTEAAHMGEFGDDTRFRQGGGGGSGLLSLQGRFLLHPGVKGGGGGMGAFDNGGGDGGGTLTVLAQAAVVNGATGIINADASGGAEGSGGGGGGIIILASLGSVTNNGTMSANGGDGGPSNNMTSSGGGGGGGIINMLAPVVNQGAGASASVAGGAGGAAILNSVNSSPRLGGGGGGASRGRGGDGGNMDAGATVTPEDAQAGLSGEVYISLLDPTPLL